MGTRILAGRYELLEKIGEGGMAVVFRAKDRTLDRFVALKILRPEYTNDESFIESFLRESQLVAGIVDPNIVQVYDVGQEGNIHYIVMELVEGEPLAEIIKREGRLDAHTVVSYGKQIASALSTAHSNLLIHRDIKPHNIMVTYDGVAKLTDFGIAKRISPEQNLSGDEKEAVMGSIHYFSPEQARGIPVDARTDIYSLGIVMYEMITGRVPYDGENAVEVAVKHMNEPMIPPSKFAFEMPQDLEDIILKATAKSADKRFTSADAMIYALSFVKFSKLVKYTPEIEEPDITEEPVVKKEKKPISIKKYKPGIAMMVAMCFLAFSFLTSFIEILFTTTPNINKTIKVPKVIEMSYEQAKKVLEEAGLKIAIDSEVINHKYEPGTVVSQTPSEDSIIKTGQVIKVNISKKDLNVVIPEVRGKDQQSAVSVLSSSGFVVDVVEVIDPNIERSMVIKTIPKSGDSIKRGETVKLYVSLGPADTKEKFTLNLIGLTEEEAKKLLEDNHCSYINGGYRADAANTSGVKPGCVISQTPKATAAVTEGTEFTLYFRNQTDADIVIEKNVTLVLDFEELGLKEGEYTIAIVVKDSYLNKNGTTQYTKTENSVTITEEMESLSYVIHGKGKGSCVVIINNDAFNYSVNFDEGTYTLNTNAGQDN